MSHENVPPLTVLLVEDNDIHADVIRRHLKKSAGDQVQLHHERRLSAALARLEQAGVDVLLLDLGLPDSGLSETLPAVIEAHPRVPVIVLTSLDDVDFGTRAVQQGAQDYLVKSDLNGQLLYRCVRYAVERKRNQERVAAYAAELERSNEHLKAFAHTLAHELKSPLGVVSGCIELLQHEFGDQFDARAGELVRDAHQAVSGLTQLMDELLDLARLDSAEQDFGEVDLEAVFYQTCALLRPAIKRSRAAITHDPLPSVRGNEAQLRQLLGNLVANAIKYCGRQPPRVHIDATESDGNWTIGVRDRGIGIALEDHSRIFDVFTRSESVRGLPGTGIGLALSKRIIQRHGGRIWVESTPGEGSTFFFTLPSPERFAG